jgi:predicted MFS family arabinose efflux permease
MTLHANTLTPLPARPWAAVAAVTAGIFVIVTAEILPIGLLLPIAATFGVSAGTSGLMMTAPGLVAAVAAPVATVLTARLDRRLVLAGWMAALTSANLVCAVATEYWMVLAARVLVGAVIGGFWSVGAGLAGRLVPPAQAGRATSTIFLAVPLGSVLGVPLGTLLADAAGWRATFGALAAVTAVVFAALLSTLPALPPLRVTRIAVLADLLRRRQVLIGIAVTVLVVIAHFGAYTYVSAFLERQSGLGLGVVGVLLLAYGAAGLAGNALAGRTLANHLPATFATAALAIAVATVGMVVFGHDIAGVVAPLLLWGVAYGAVPACSQAWLARHSDGADEAATVLFTSAFQATISVGALLGGLVVDHLSLRVLMVLAGAVAIAGAGVVAASRITR